MKRHVKQEVPEDHTPSISVNISQLQLIQLAELVKKVDSNKSSSPQQVTTRRSRECQLRIHTKI